MTSASDTRPASLMIVALALVLVGCGDKPRVDQKPTHRVRGQVLLDGRPVSGALVVLYPLDEADSDVVRSYARTGADGRFTISTYEVNDGAPAGRYAATVMLYDDKDGVHRLPSRYASKSSSNLRVEVKEGDNVLRPFNLVPNPTP